MELFAGIRESVVAPEGQPGAVRLGRGDGLRQLLDGDASRGQGVGPVGDPLPGEDVRDVETATPTVGGTAPCIDGIHPPDPVGRAALIASSGP